MEQLSKRESNNNVEIFKSKNWKIEDFERIFEYYHQPEKRKKLKLVKDEKSENVHGSSHEEEYADDKGRIIVEDFGDSSNTDEDLASSSDYSYNEYSYSNNNISEVFFKNVHDGEYDQVDSGRRTIGKIKVEYDNGAAKKIIVEKFIEESYNTEISSRYKVRIDIDIIYKNGKVEKIYKNEQIEKENGEKESKLVSVDYSKYEFDLKYFLKHGAKI